MENLLDSILANTGNGPVVLASNNDVNSINWVAGLSDPGEMLACGYLPEARRLANETDAEYAKRLLTTLPQHLIDQIKAAAIARASLCVTNGKVNLMVAVGANGEKLPWHVLGTMIAEACNSADALRLSGLAGQIMEKVPLSYSWNGQVIESADTFAIIRTDTGAQVGKCGTGYKVIQNSQGFECLDSLLSEFGAKYESAGALFGGKEAFCVALLPGGFEFPGQDKNHTYAMFTLDHSGAGADNCFSTEVRSICANTKTLALAGKKNGFSLRHTGDVKAKIADARRALGLTVLKAEEFKSAAEAMYRTRVEPKEFIGSILDQVLEVSAAQSKQGADVLAAAIAKTDEEREQMAKSFAKQIARRENILADILERHESATTPTESRGTVWGAVNAVTESSDRARPWRRFNGEQAESRRFWSAIDGESEQVKEVAYANARALVAN